MEKQGYLTVSEFREVVWPEISKLCKAKEIPAQSLFLLVKNTDLLSSFISASDFSAYVLPLLLKSLDCGVPKLQFLALSKIPDIHKKVDYNMFKTSLMPRILQTMEKASSPQVKVKVLETIIEIIEGIDKTTL